MNFYQYHKKLQTAHFVLILSATILGSIGLVFIDQIPVQTEFKNDFLYLVPVVLLLMITIANYYFHRSIENIRRSSRLSPKLKAYSHAVLFKWSVLTIPAFFSSSAYLLTRYSFFLALFILPLLLLLLSRPTPQKIQEDLDLSNAERRVLADIELQVV